ncbi:MAG: extracellular solute-binding protein [Chloroflexales bacterium]|nr:extracellular solute-binding protein [Chloroflexales bacterium]
MTFPRQIRWILVTLLVLLTLAGCGGAAVGPTPTAAPAAAPSARTVLLLWHAWPYAQSRALAGLLERFNRANPSIQIVSQMRPAARLRADMVDAMAEGVGPHLAIVPSHTLGGLVDDGALLPADDLLPSSELARLLPAAVGAAQVDGAAGATLYGIPITFDTLALFYNKANFTGDPPADTDTMLQVARDIANVDSAPPYWGLAYTLSLDRTIGYMYAFGGRIFDEQGQVVLGVDGRAGAEAWLTWLLSLREDPEILASVDGVAVDNALNTQRALMTIDWAHAAASYSAIWPGSLGVAPLPRLSGANEAPRPYVQSDVLVLNARLGDAAERAAATAFTRYMLAEAAQRELLRAGYQPVLMSLDLREEDPAVPPALREAAAAFRAQAEAGQPMPNSRAANEVVWSVLADMQGSVLRRLLTPAQAVDGADASLRARLQSP